MKDVALSTRSVETVGQRQRGSGHDRGGNANPSTAFLPADDDDVGHSLWRDDRPYDGILIPSAILRLVEW